MSSSLVKRAQLLSVKLQLRESDSRESAEAVKKEMAAVYRGAYLEILGSLTKCHLAPPSPISCLILHTEEPVPNAVPSESARLPLRGSISASKGVAQ